MLESPVLRRKKAAQYLGLAEVTLAKMAVRGDGPRFVKLGPKAVGYLRSDLDAWLDERRRSSTSEKSAA